MFQKGKLPGIKECLQALQTDNGFGAAVFFYRSIFSSGARAFIRSGCTRPGQVSRCPGLKRHLSSKLMTAHFDRNKVHAFSGTGYQW
jgi:hypothetical protein